MASTRLSDIAQVYPVYIHPPISGLPANKKFYFGKVNTTMTMQKDEKQKIIETYAVHEGDTGSP